MTDKSAKRYDKIKKHFESEARIFDANFFKILPFYHEMISALVSCVPFKKGVKIRALDLGCGTGNITKALKERYPGASVLCVDLAENMLALARSKLSGFKRVEYWLGDIRSLDYSKKYNVIISSLALHHVEEKEKGVLYRKIYGALTKGGVFYNADLIVASNNYLAGMYLEKWKAFMRRSFSVSKINNVILKHKDDEDRPVKLATEMAFLDKAGFKDLDVVWKYYNFAVYGGKKR